MTSARTASPGPGTTGRQLHHTTAATRGADGQVRASAQADHSTRGTPRAKLPPIVADRTRPAVSACCSARNSAIMKASMDAAAASRRSIGPTSGPASYTDRLRRTPGGWNLTSRTLTSVHGYTVAFWVATAIYIAGLVTQIWTDKAAHDTWTQAADRGRTPPAVPSPCPAGASSRSCNQVRHGRLA